MKRPQIFINEKNKTPLDGGVLKSLVRGFRTTPARYAAGQIVLAADTLAEIRVILRLFAPGHHSHTSLNTASARRFWSFKASMPASR